MALGDWRTRLLQGPLLPPLGVSVVPLPDERCVPLGTGCALVLYTDGLIERRGERLATRQQALFDVAVQSPADPDLLCESVLTESRNARSAF